MVTKKIDTRSLSLELLFPALKLEIKVNVELRVTDGTGKTFLESDFNRKVYAAISEALQLHSDLFRFETIRDLPKSTRARTRSFDELNGALKGVVFSDRWLEHNADQLDLFDYAGEYGMNLINGGFLVSPTDDSKVVAGGNYFSIDIDE